MGFLELNGVTIPVNRCEEIHKELGERSRTFGGTYNLSRRATKRSWRFATPPLEASVAEAIKGMVRGVGNCWRFDDASLYDAKGVTLDVAGSQYTALADLTDTLEDKVYSGVIQYGRESKISTVEPTRYSIRVDRASVNRLSSAGRKGQVGSAATMQSYGGAALADSTDYSWAGGGYSVKVTPDGAGGQNDGCNSEAVATQATYFVTGSVYMYSAETSDADRTFTVDVYDADNAVTSSVATVIIPQNKWTRVVVPSVELTLASTDVRIRIRQGTADVALDFYIDGLQIEEHATESGATAWVDGTRASADVIISPDMSINEGGGNFCVNTWMSGTEFGTVPRYLWDITNTLGAPRWLVTLQAGNVLRLSIFNSPGTLTEINSSYDFQGGLGYDIGIMQMVTIVIRKSPEGAQKNAEVYINGVLTGSNDITDMGNLNDIADDTIVGIGCRHNGVSPLDGSMDDFAILPYAPDAATIAAWYANGQYSAVPAHTASGDFCQDPSVQVIGELKSTKTVPKAAAAGTWQNNAQSLGFTLHEV